MKRWSDDRSLLLGNFAANSLGTYEVVLRSTPVLLGTKGTPNLLRSTELYAITLTSYTSKYLVSDPYMYSCVRPRARSRGWTDGPQTN